MGQTLGFDWYWPRPLEGVLFDYALYVEGDDAFDGHEATRRSEYLHGAFVRDRAPEREWITPLMELKSSDMRKTPERETDVFKIGGGLLFSERARKIVQPLAGANVEFLPVETVQGRQLWWAIGPIVPEALDLEASSLFFFQEKLDTIQQPVVRTEHVPAEAGLFAFDNFRSTPVLSQAIVTAMKDADLYGIDTRPVKST